MRLLFMGTPQFAVPTLEGLLSSSHDVAAVFTQPDKPSGRGERVSAPPVKRTAQKHGVSIFQPDKLKTEASKFASLRPDAVIVVAYGKILPAWLFNMPRYGAINLHASLLPRYRGAAPINWTVANGESVTGVTTMKIDAGLDTGDILLQKSLAIGPEDTASEIHDRLASIGSGLVLATLDLLERDAITPVPQDPSLATYAPMLRKVDGELNWSQTATEIYDRVRGFNPWPGTYTYLKGAALRIWKAIPIETSICHKVPGLLTHAGSSGAIVTCRLGSLQLQEVQLENRKKIFAQDFLHGIRLPQGQAIVLGR
jgi:methionyl-tRNA formyltransferase